MTVISRRDLLTAGAALAATAALPVEAKSKAKPYGDLRDIKRDRSSKHQRLIAAPGSSRDMTPFLPFRRGHGVGHGMRRTRGWLTFRDRGHEPPLLEAARRC
jgi:hypothetical protein